MRARGQPAACFVALLAAACVERAEVLSPEPDGGGGNETVAVTDVSLGDEHGCAVVGSRLYCWGNNDVGQLGTGSTSLPALTPTRVAGQ